MGVSLGQDSDQWRALVNMVVILRFRKRGGGGNVLSR
jgi:hypothetical protein